MKFEEGESFDYLLGLLVPPDRLVANPSLAGGRRVAELRGLEVVRLDRRVQMIGPLHAAEDQRLGAGSRMARKFRRIPGEKAYDLGLFGFRKEDDELEAEEEDERNKLKSEGKRVYYNNCVCVSENKNENNNVYVICVKPLAFRDYLFTFLHGANHWVGLAKRMELTAPSRSQN